MQKAAYNGLGTHNGAVVAIETKTGNILVFTSKPGFDPNPFVHGISAKDYDQLRSSANQPLFDRALRGQYPPGSTVKPFIGLAGLEYGVVDMKHSIFCRGFYQLPNVSHKYRDWKTWGHGHVDMTAAITQSCDVYFYGLAYSLGIERLSGFLKKFGFGSKTGIDLGGEKAGLLPSRKWKRQARNEPWYPGETLITGIGQGFLQVTPLQLAKATAQLANRGKAVRPHLVRRIEHKAESMIPLQRFSPDIQIDPRNAESIIRAMVNVVHGDRGTARSISNGINYKIAGKTGTAQVFTVKQEENYDESRIDEKLRDHALFVAFAPAHDPRIAIAVVVENGGHGGSVAAPIARDVIHQYLGRES
jgi:penicillin-binding protein 2